MQVCALHMNLCPCFVCSIELSAGLRPTLKSAQTCAPTQIAYRV